MNQALSSVEKLARQRQAAAVARAHAHMLQLKVVVVCGCAIAGAIGFALHRASTASNAAPASIEEKSGLYQGPSSQRIGQIQVPHEGDTCLHYRFDNQTGVIGDESTVSCAPVNIVPSVSGVSRIDAMMKAFRFGK